MISLTANVTFSLVGSVERSVSTRLTTQPPHTEQLVRDT